MLLHLAFAVSAASALVVPKRAPGNLTVGVPASYTYKLNSAFSANASNPFVQTQVSNGTIASALSGAAQKAFISFDQEFLTMLGSDPQVDQIASAEGGRFYETGAWVAIFPSGFLYVAEYGHQAYDKGKMFFTSSIIEGPTVCMYFSRWRVIVVTNVLLS